MRVVRSINNNIAVCIDSVGNELIAMGKGIGYGELPREVSLEDVTQTFYNVSPEVLSGIKDIPEDVMAFSADLAERARDELPYELSPNLAFTLADHIGFALRRGRENLYVSMPLVFDVKQSYPDEYRIARHAVRRLRRVFGVNLREDEAAGIALNIVNARSTHGSRVCPRAARRGDARRHNRDHRIAVRHHGLALLLRLLPLCHAYELPIRPPPRGQNARRGKPRALCRCACRLSAG